MGLCNATKKTPGFEIQIKQFMTYAFYIIVLKHLFQAQIGKISIVQIAELCRAHSTTHRAYQPRVQHHSS